MSNPMNENPNVHAEFFTIVATGETGGEVSLNLNACGTDYANLPEDLVIPNEVNQITVTSLVPGMFSDNKKVRSITFPSMVTHIPANFCKNATNLRSIYCTDSITNIGSTAFMSTRIKCALFPKLIALDTGSFIGCAYLETVDIGQVSSIPPRTFANCALLHDVIAGNTVTSIGEFAFYYTRGLKELPLLANVTTVGSNAFSYSSIRTFLKDGTISSTAFPVNQNSTDFWSGVPFTPCRNRIATKLSHKNAAWINEYLPGKSTTYANSRALFAVMHIHSAITGKYYSHPSEFANELGARNISQCYENGWTGAIENVEDLFIALGHRTEVRGKDKSLDSKDYKALVDALAHGGYVYTQIHTQDNVSGLHGVALYGIDESGDVCVLDSLTMHEPFRADGLEPGIDIYTYTTPYQNLVYPTQDFIIVYPTGKEPTVEWTGFADANMFTSDSLPSGYPENQVTICRVTNDNKMPGSKNGILTAYRVGDIAYRTYLPDTEAALHMQILSEAGDAWSDWVDCNQKDFTWLDDNQVLNNTEGNDGTETTEGTESAVLPHIPYGVSVCAVSRTDSGLPGGGVGYMTIYRLHPSHTEGPESDSNENTDIIRQEWQPYGTHEKYVRYFVTGQQPGDNWYVFTPAEYTPPAEGASGEGQ